MTSTYSRSELEAIRDAHYEQLLLNGDDDTEPTVSSGDCDECGFGRNFPCPPYRLATFALSLLPADDEVARGRALREAVTDALNDEVGEPAFGRIVDAIDAYDKETE
jgi:hypothetical protein